MATATTLKPGSEALIRDFAGDEVEIFCQCALAHRHRLRDHPVTLPCLLKRSTDFGFEKRSARCVTSPHGPTHFA
jgi:hypothetical protein